MKSLKRSITVVVMTTSMLGGFAATTYTATVNGIKWEYLVNNGEASISGLGVESMFASSLIIPSILGNRQVTSIRYDAFEYNKYVQSVRIPSSVRYIGECAFFSCSSLTNVTMGSGVTSIRRAAFALCGSLRSITIPDGVTSIGENAFDLCSNITSVTISQYVCTNNLYSIFPDAFRAITNIVISDSVTNIGDGAFSGCRALTHVTIPRSVTIEAAKKYSDFSAEI